MRATFSDAVCVAKRCALSSKLHGGDQGISNSHMSDTLVNFPYAKAISKLRAPRMPSQLRQFAVENVINMSGRAPVHRWDSCLKMLMATKTFVYNGCSNTSYPAANVFQCSNQHPDSPGKELLPEICCNLETISAPWVLCHCSNLVQLDLPWRCRESCEQLPRLMC